MTQTSWLLTLLILLWFSGFWLIPKRWNGVLLFLFPLLFMVEYWLQKRGQVIKEYRTQALYKGHALMVHLGPQEMTIRVDGVNGPEVAIRYEAIYEQTVNEFGGRRAI